MEASPSEARSGRHYLEAWLCAIAQVAFLDKPLHGGLLLAAVAMVSPWSAFGAGLGAALAILIGRHGFHQDEREWAGGLGAYDSALVGLAWAGVLSRGGGNSLLFPLAILACLAWRRPIQRLGERLALPPLGAAGLLTVWLSLAVFASLGGDFWSFAVPPDPTLFELAFACLAILAAMWLKHRVAATVAALAAAAAALLLLILGTDPRTIGGAGLWAFTVAPAVFAFPATLLPACRLGWRLAGLAAAVATLVWLAWPHLSLFAGLPPLMAPLFIGLWLAAWLLLGAERRLFLDPQIQHSAQLLAAARARGGAVALTGAGISTASGIPDYTDGAWLDPQVPLACYGFDAFLADAGCRRLYWQACARFRERAAQARANPAHAALAALAGKGYVAATITQNVDGLHQSGGSGNVIELHGNIGEVTCLLCGTSSPWPASQVSGAGDLLCPHCAGYLKPAVIAFGEGIAPEVWRRAQSAASQAPLLLVVGSQLAVSSASALLAAARANGAQCIFITLGWLACPVFPGDRVLVQPAERVLPVLARYLDIES